MKNKNFFTNLFSRSMRGRTVSFLLVIVAYAVLSGLIASGNLTRLFTSMLVPICAYIVAAIGLNMNVGFSGELNLGQAGFMAVGGFTAIIVSGSLAPAISNEALRLALSIVCGAAMAALFGLVISIPVLKLQGDYLAIVTLAFGQIMMSIVTNLYVGVDASGLHFSFVNNNLQLGEGGTLLISGPMGATGVDKISSFTAGVILILLSLVIVYHIIYSKEGRAIQACRDNRIAAETVGINVSHTKTLAFVVSACLAGAAGALYVLNYTSVVATKFDFNTSILILVYVVLGGLGNMTGTIIATTLLFALPEVLRFLSTYRMLIYAIVLIMIMLISNNAKLKVLMERFKNKLKNKKDKEVTE
jgi:branched-chain amino acid transport system permease protein